MKMLRSPALSPAVLLLLRSHVVKALCPQEISISGTADSPGQADRLTEFRMRIIGRKAVVPGPSLRVETVSNGNRFQQSGFSAAVLPRKEGDRMRKRNILCALDRRDLPQIAVAADFLPVDLHAIQQLCVHHGFIKSLLIFRSAGNASIPIFDVPEY